MPRANRLVHPNTVLIHVGPHKTGTTAIQKTLKQNRQYLKQFDVIYPDIGTTEWGHHKLVDALDQNLSLDRERRELDRISAGTVVLSSENFSRLSPESLSRLSGLVDSFEHIHIVLYLRNFLQLLYAWWQELVKHRQEDDLCHYLAISLSQPFRTHLLDASNMLQKFAQIFGAESITVFLYEGVMESHGDTAHHFMNEVLQVPEYEPQPGL